jgi:apolipoprotein N-acyltransferase
MPLASPFLARLFLFVRQIHRGAWLLALVSGILQVLIFPSPNLYWLCWVALAPLIVALLAARPPDGSFAERRPASGLQGFVLAYMSGVIWYLGTCYWVFHVMHQYGGVSAPGSAGILVLFCLYLAIYHGLFGFMICFLAAGRERGARRALLLAPFLWVAAEFARARLSAFPWDLLGTAQVDNIALNRLATVTGVYGLSFEIVLINTVFAAAFLMARERRRKLLAEVALVAVILQVLAFSKWPSFPTDHAALLVQANIPILTGDTWTTQYFEGTMRDLVWISTNAPEGERRRKPDLIVWPESPAPFYASDPKFRDAVAEVARQTGTYLVVGSNGTPAGDMGASSSTTLYNSASVMSPAGAWGARYDKVHLVPFGEYLPFKSLFGFAGGLTKEVGSYAPGVSREPLSAGAQKIGVFICYESVFPDEIREFAHKGAQVFVNISDDGWYGEHGAFAQHLYQARMRAVENDRWMLRATDTGVTAAIDPYGRVTASVPREMRTALPAGYSLRNETTFYTRHGDWFAGACAIISLAALLWRLRVPARERL